MTPRSSLPAPIWVAVLVASLAFLVWVNGPRRERIERVTAVAQGPLQVSGDSPTGYAGGTRELIIPERLSASQEAIAHTQQMLERGTWRVRHFDRDNAPFGREVHASSLYRWWLAGVAWLHHVFQEQPVAFSVERAALHADPLLHALWLIAATILAARIAGGWAAAVLAAGGALVYPFAAGFMPGVPEEHALALALGTLSVLVVLGGVSKTRAGAPAAAQTEPRRRRKLDTQANAGATAAPGRRWMIAGGVLGGLGVWNNPQAQIPLVLGLALGAVAAAWAERSRGQAAGHEAGTRTTPAWRAWGVAGAVTVCVGWLVEFLPTHLLSWEWRAVHPLYAVGWLSLGELLTHAVRWVQSGLRPRAPREGLAAAAGLTGLVAVPLAAAWTGGAGLLSVDPLAFRLTKQIGAPIVPNLSSWLAADGLTLPAATTLLAVVGIIAGLTVVVRQPSGSKARAHVALALLPALVAAAFGYLHLRWWQMAGGCALLVLAIAVAEQMRTGIARRAAVAWAGLALGWFGMGAYQLAPQAFLPPAKSLSIAEAEAIVGRHLGQWLARRSGVPDGAVILAPPAVSTTLCYHAELRGIASLSWENKEGMGAAIRVAISTSRDETHALCQRRELNYLILPTWDTFFQPFVDSASVQVGSLFLPSLQRWIVPPWLRPIPYEMPSIPGFENHAVVVFEMVEDQEEPVALSRLTEYFIEMSQPQKAQVIAESLRQFPADFGALVARAQLESALGEREAFAGTVDTLLKRMTAGGDRFLPFDRRVSLATVLARAQRFDQARTQVQRCVAGLDEAALRSLTPYALFHFLGLCKGFGVQIADEHLRDIALEVLPLNLRSRL